MTPWTKAGRMVGSLGVSLGHLSQPCPGLSQHPPFSSLPSLSSSPTALSVSAEPD